MSATLGPSDEGTPGTVRPATPADADAVATLLTAAWRESFGDAVAGQLPAADVVATSWREALTSPAAGPADRRPALLIAIGGTPAGGSEVAGLLAHRPSDDPDADPQSTSLIGELAIAPDQRGRGHASRLLAAWADTARASGYSEGAIWIPSDAEALRQLLLECGWAPDSAYRNLETDAGTPLTVVRLVTTL